ncbi:MAG: hypothetical protein KIH65_005090 [Candidatus Uhrbacteria bacterium]|nr:hypothetical protein [Candidatus Uhrbacteria bacterium]
MSTSSILIKRVAVLLAAAVCLGMVFWVGSKLLEPTNVPPPLPPKSLVSFQGDTAVLENPLFKTLQTFVTGEVVLGPVGNGFPFGASVEGDASSTTATDIRLQLATFESVPVGDGYVVKDLIRGRTGKVVALLYRPEGDGVTYDIRTYAWNEMTIFASWRADAGAGSRVAGIAEDSSGSIWMLNERGGVGRVKQGESPTWLGVQTGLTGSKLRIAIDTADQVWISDGMTVAVGSESSFTPVDLYAGLSEGEREKLTNQLALLPPSIKPMPQGAGLDGLVRAALQPEDFFQLADGRLALTTGYGVMRFPLSQTNRIEWIDTLDSLALPLAVATNGDVWALRYTDEMLMRLRGSESSGFRPGSSPKDARTNPDLFTSAGSRFFAFDYAATSTFLWSTDGTVWGNQIVAASGTMPNDTARKIVSDRFGGIWAILNQGGLMRIFEGAKIE